VKVRYFAQAADVAGCREEMWDIAAPLDLDQFWQEVIRRHPAFSSLCGQCRVASGGEYVTRDNLVSPTEEAAVIPPVSGG